MRTRRWLWCLTVLLSGVLPLAADEPVTLDNVVTPEPNSPDEPFAEDFSMEQALHFLDSAALDWQQSWQCVTCHTNISYLIARPTISGDAPAHREVRKYAEALIARRWEEVGPRFDAEIVAIAAAMALNDAATTNTLHPLTRNALDRMWTVQRDSGDWEWPTRCRWPPMESDQHYGVTLAAIATGAAPGDYAKTPAAQAGLAKIRAFLKVHPAPDLHHKGMILWASTYVDGLMAADERQAFAAELIAAQRPDGGWSFASLYPWKRSDGTQQDVKSSDGYGTGFAIFALRKAGVLATKPAVQQGVAWLKSHQRASGRWFTRSLNKDNEHFISHAGSAFAVMALAACAADPTMINDSSPPVLAYLAEQKRRRLTSVVGLRQRIEKSQRDKANASLVRILKEQLAELESTPLEPVNFDSAYGYPPTTGRVGYARRVRLLENTSDGKSIIRVANVPLLLDDLDTSQYPSGKFLRLDKAILIGPTAPDRTVQGVKATVFTAKLVDFDSVLKSVPSKNHD